MIILNIDILYIEFWYDDVNFGILIFKLYIMIDYFEYWYNVFWYDEYWKLWNVFFSEMFLFIYRVFILLIVVMGDII